MQYQYKKEPPNISYLFAVFVYFFNGPNLNDKDTESELCELSWHIKYYYIYTRVNTYINMTNEPESKVSLRHCPCGTERVSYY